MTLGAAIDAEHSLPAMGADPACRMVVPVVLGNAGTLAASASEEEEC